MKSDKPNQVLKDAREIAMRLPEKSEGTGMMWRNARHAMLEAQRARAVARTQVAELAADKAFRTRYQNIMLARILDAAIEDTSADMGNIQLLDRATGQLRIEVHRGFQAPFLDFFSTGEAGHAACGMALKSLEPVVVEDAAHSPIFCGIPSLEALLDANVRAVRSMPLIGSDGQPFGVISIHYRTPHAPSRRELTCIEYYARQAAELAEWCQDTKHENASSRKRICRIASIHSKRS